MVLVQCSHLFSKPDKNDLARDSGVGLKISLTSKSWIQCNIVPVPVEAGPNKQQHFFQYENLYSLGKQCKPTNKLNKLIKIKN
jgi:hypothetical protein